MVARKEIRRRAFFDDHFSTGVRVLSTLLGRSFEVRPPRPPAPKNPLGRGPDEPETIRQDLVKISDDDDEVLIVPGSLMVVNHSPVQAALSAQALGEDDLSRMLKGVLDDNHVTVDDDEVLLPGTDIVSFTLTPDPDVEPIAALVGATLGIIVVGNRGGPVSVAPEYGFITHQTTQPSDDPEPVHITLPVPTGTKGAGTRIAIVDTGRDPNWLWGLATDGYDDDPLASPLAVPPNATQPKGPGTWLGRAAAHGTFIGGLIRQIAPAAVLSFPRAVDTEGLVSESELHAALASLTSPTTGVAPDIVVVPLGGYLVKGPWVPNGDQIWIDPLLLRAALLDLLNSKPGTLVLCSAGNSGSADPCYPAAFTLDAAFGDRLASVTALDVNGRICDFSNLGYPDHEWVSAATLGKFLHSLLCVGYEHPNNDPDLDPDYFGPDDCAEWDGTSFSVAIAAGKVAALLAELRKTAPGTTAVQAWEILVGISSPAQDAHCGVRILVDDVAHG
jgi:hypothetical protein